MKDDAYPATAAMEMKHADTLFFFFFLLLHLRLLLSSSASTHATSSWPSNYDFSIGK